MVSMKRGSSEFDFEEYTSLKVGSQMCLSNVCSKLSLRMGGGSVQSPFPTAESEFAGISCIARIPSYDMSMSAGTASTCCRT